MLCGVPCVGLRFLLYVFTVFCCMCLWCGVVGVLGGGCVMVVATMWCVCVMVCTALPPHMPMLCLCKMAHESPGHAHAMGVALASTRMPAVLRRAAIWGNMCSARVVVGPTCCAVGWAVIDRLPTDRPRKSVCCMYVV